MTGRGRGIALAILLTYLFTSLLDYFHYIGVSGFGESEIIAEWCVKAGKYGCRGYK